MDTYFKSKNKNKIKIKKEADTSRARKRKRSGEEEKRYSRRGTEEEVQQKRYMQEKRHM